MVDLPKKKVGIVACSGEELPEGTITRLAALKGAGAIASGRYCNDLFASLPGGR